MTTDEQDPLRAVVKHWAFEWRRNMMAADGSGIFLVGAPEIWNERGTSRGCMLADHPANVGPLLEMLRASCGAGMFVDFDTGSDDVNVFNPISEEWESFPHDECGLVVALCRALLSLPPRGEP